MSGKKKSTVKRFPRVQPIFFEADVDDNALLDPSFNIQHHTIHNDAKKPIYDDVTPMRSHYYEIKA